MSETPQLTIEFRIALSVADAAAACGVSRTAIYDWLNSGLPSRKIGDRRLIRVADLDNWIASQPTTPPNNSPQRGGRS